MKLSIIEMLGINCVNKGDYILRTIKRFTSWMLIAAMAGCLALPVQATNTYTDGNTLTKEQSGTNSEDKGGAGNGGTTTPGSGEAGSSEATTTEQGSSDSSETTTEQEVTTETTTEKTTEQPTTEQPTTQAPVKAADVTATGLSPLTSKVIVIDPGHCKKHTGAYGHGLREEVVVMDIADACQEVLDNYGDITVYMTRDANSCCASLGLGECLSARNNYAKRLNADFLVSMHINAGRSSGANVLTAYKSGYNDNIRKETQAFGRLALQKLKAIGISNRGLLLRRSENGTRYSNGRLADYYSIVRRGVVQQVPGVIIEHGYITSASDCLRFFRTKAKRAKVGQADAQAIISYYGLNKKLVTGKISREADGTYYRLASNMKAGGFVKEDGVWYYFDENTGKMCTGFQNVGSETVYLSPSTGQMVVGWFTMDGKRYLAKGNGALVKGTAYDDGVHKYLFDETGALLTNGNYMMNGTNYYVDANGYVASGIVTIKGVRYGFDPQTNRMLYGYQKVNGYYYYFDEVTGQMQTGWQKIDGKYRYFKKSSGKMQRNKWIGKYYVNANGIRTKRK